MTNRQMTTLEVDDYVVYVASPHEDELVPSTAINRSNGRNVFVVFDGWLENRDELSARLNVGCFDPQQSAHAADASLVAQAHQHWGHEAPQQLFGEYSYVAIISQGASIETVAVRDKIGSRPLYYLSNDGHLEISNFPGAIRSKRVEVPPIDEGYVAELLCWEVNSVQSTCYRGVTRVLGGEYITFNKDRGLRTTRYWLPPRPSYMTWNDAVERFSRVLSGSVLSAAKSPTTVGLRLSGGIDSSTVAAILGTGQKRGALDAQKVTCLSLTYGKLACDESKLIQQTARQLPFAVRFFDPRYPSPAVLQTRCSRLLYPSPTFASSASDVLAEALRTEGGRVLLDGNGGDELFIPYGPFILQSLAKPRSFNAALTRIAGYWHSENAEGPLGRRILNAVCRLGGWEASNLLMRHVLRKRRNSLYAVDDAWARRIRLGDRLDRLTPSHSASTVAAAQSLSGYMAHAKEWLYHARFLQGVEVRSPLQSASIIDFTNTLPLACLDKAGAPDRMLLREALARTAVSLPHIVNRTEKAEFSSSLLPAVTQALRLLYGEEWTRPPLGALGHHNASAATAHTYSFWQLQALLAVSVFLNTRLRPSVEE